MLNSIIISAPDFLKAVHPDSDFGVYAPVLSDADLDNLRTLSGFIATAEDKDAFALFVGKISSAMKEYACAQTMEQADHLTAVLSRATFGRISYNASNGAMKYTKNAGYVSLDMLDSFIRKHNSKNKKVEGFTPVELRHGLSREQVQFTRLFGLASCKCLSPADFKVLEKLTATPVPALSGFFKLQKAKGEASISAQSDIMAYFYGLFNARLNMDGEKAVKAVGKYADENGNRISVFDFTARELRSTNSYKWTSKDNSGSFLPALSSLVNQYLHSDEVIKDKSCDDKQEASTILAELSASADIEAEKANK